MVQISFTFIGLVAALIVQASPILNREPTDCTAGSGGPDCKSLHIVTRAASPATRLENAIEAQKLNKLFVTLTAQSPCNTGETACVEKKLAQCLDGKFLITSCSSGLQCAALPLDNSPGTTITCDTPGDAEARIATAGAAGGLTGSE